MAVPDYQSVMRPLLAFAADGTEKNINDAIAAIAAEFELSDAERSQLVSSGKQRLLDNRVHWARTYLDKAGAIRKTRRSHFTITERGAQLLLENPARVDAKTLRQFPEFLAFVTPKRRSAEGADATQTPTEEAADNVAELQTPEEAIVRAESTITESLAAEILDRVLEMSPTFFEQLVIDLIVAMGYGGSRDIVAERLGKSGDEGIDGVVNEDALGLDMVHVQAKRYAPDNTIGRERIQQFSGALTGQGANKGVFVTTSSFSRGAIEYAQRVSQRIVLIDGANLASLMIRYGVGVRTERVVEIKKIDTDYFRDEDAI